MAINKSASRNFVQVTHPEPHLGRRREILKAHPELRQLFGATPSSFIYVVAIVITQFGLAYTLRSSPWWLVLVSAYMIGAVANHSLFVFIHECTHNLIFKGITASRLTAIFANLPIVAPVAMGFRKYHLLHHKHQGDVTLDADLPSHGEALLIGEGPVRKSIWLFVFAFVEGAVRPAYLKTVKLMDQWVWFNSLVVIGFAAAFTVLFGAKALVYLFASTIFSVGLHPLGARWIQEHYVFKADQETYSYYGPANKVAFNVGYHNEHHDFMNVAWSRLPEIKRMAPEYYDNLFYHTSYIKLLLTFITKPHINLFSRVIRPSLELGEIDKAPDQALG